MNDGSYLMLACLAGMLLGVVFFGGLWWTVRKCMTTPHPALWLLGSAMTRMSLILAGFYFVSDGKWTRLLSCLVGFMIARLFVTRLSRAIQTNPAEFEQKGAEETERNLKSEVDVFFVLRLLRNILFKTTNITAEASRVRSSRPKREANHAS